MRQFFEIRRLHSNSRLVVWLIAVLAGCDRQAATQPSDPANATPSVPPAKREWGDARFNVCALVTKEEVEQVQSTVIKETKSAGGPDVALYISQCFYLTPDGNPSVGLSVVEKNAKGRGQRTPKSLWKEMFYPEKEREKEEEQNKREEAEEEALERARRERFPPRKIAGLGDDAYWNSGALYVLKRKVFLRIAVSGLDDEETKIKKAKLLAEKALPRL